MTVINQMEKSITTTIHKKFIALYTYRMKTVDQLQEKREVVPTTVHAWNIGDKVYDSE